MKLKFILFLLAMILAIANQAFSQPRTVSNQSDPDVQKLRELSQRFRQRNLQQKAEIERIAKEKGWQIRKEMVGGVMEIRFIDQFGFPQAYRTTNLNAGRTTNTDDIWQGGSTGLNLTGDGYLVGEWDGGGVLTTHQEFNNGSGTRVTQMDAPASTHYHSTHVAGTIVAEGQVNAAHGMATEALLHAYDWNDDDTEMADAAASGLTLSNHSYGFTRGWVQDGSWYWYGNPTISATEDYLFGFYDSYAQDWDEIAFNAPNYLIVKSSGNDRNDDWNSGHYVLSGGSWVWSTAARDPDGGADGYDCIDQHGVPKNILTIGAVNDIPGGWTAPGDVVQSAFSSWGPTDDGRIKPDLVANGVGVYSTTNTGISNYTTLDGTSMATPNTTGTLVLLQEHYKNGRGGTLSAAALKGLVINTANEAGPANGPDYQNGWGLLNASGAANLITNDNAVGGLILQATLMNGQTTDYVYYSNGSSPINVTLCWTDPAGTPPAASLNPTTLMLVNDLDLRIIKNTTYYLPWVLNPASPAAAATKGDNIRDNVETVNILSPTAGYYTIRINHGGALSGGSQAYALIVNGMTTPPTNNYCSARSTTFAVWESISKVVMGSINHTTGRSPGGYSDYTGLVNTLVKGVGENLSVTITGYSGDEVRAWIDWNQDNDFSDAGESYLLGTGAGPTFTQTITAPSTAKCGYTTMRVRVNYSTASSCGTSTYGETEDYTIQVAYACEASGGCDEYISRVQVGSIDNSTTCSYYTDYTSLSAGIPANGFLNLTVTNGNGFLSDQCGVWVDWNRNGSFYDAGEQITVTGTPGAGPYTATISPPTGQTLGNCVMRIRITYTGTVDPCGTTTYGEVEDYTLNVTAKVPNVWTGNYNNYWGNATNWSLNHIPTADEDVIIPNVNMPCIVDYSPKECNNLTTETGSTLLISANSLTVNGDLSISGQLAMDNASGSLIVMDDIFWESGSTANISASAIMYIYGYWEFRSGSNVQLANGQVRFSGTSSKYIRNYASGSKFYNVYNYKSGGAFLGISGASTYDLGIDGFLYIFTGADFRHVSSHDLVLKGWFYNYGNFTFDFGTLVMDGTTQTIKPNLGNYLNNLTISSSGTNSFDHAYSDTLVINGNLTIESGVFNPNDQTILIRGDWTNSVGTLGFTEGASRVIFDGSGHQYVLSNETFNILEANMGAALRVNNPSHTVTCNQYDWKQGGIDVLSGTFTALDLSGDGIYGGFWINPGGVINLTNNDNFVDLNGNLNIYGGEFNIYGGAGWDCYFAENGNASINMSNGILNFRTRGAYAFNDPTYTFTENITGGLIQSSGGFRIINGAFTPSGGTIECYGPNDGYIQAINGGYFNNLIINKTSSDEQIPVSPPYFVPRENENPADLPLSNTILLSGNTDINGNLTIQNGTLSAVSYTLNVAGNWDNQVGIPGFDQGISTVVFDGAAGSDILNSETFYNLQVSKTYSGYEGVELFYDVACNNLDILDGTLEINHPANLLIDGNLNIALNAGLNANDYTGLHVQVAGNWNNANTTFDSYVGFNPGNSIVMFNGSADQTLNTAAPQEQFSTLEIAKVGGRFRPNDNIYCTGNIHIYLGNWEDNLGGLIHSVEGDFTVESSGGFVTSAMNNTLEFIGSQNSQISFITGSTGSLCNLYIDKPAGYSVTQGSPYINCAFEGNLMVENGTYNLGVNHQCIVSGDVNINDGGILQIQNASYLSLTNGNTLNVNSGGILDISGVSGGSTTVRGITAGQYYNFNVNSGGTISAVNCIFRDMTLNGVNIAASATVNPSGAFTGCTFQYGQAAGTLLTVNNNQVFTVRNAVFPTNSWGGASNVAKSVASGRVYFVDFSGGFSGESFDNDPNNRLDWIPTLTATATATSTSICAGSSTQLNITQTGGLGPFTYLWSPATGLSGTTISNPVATPLASTTYYVTVTDFLGSTVTSSIGITVNPLVPASVSIVASANPSAPGNYVLFTATPVNGGATPGYQWKVNGSNVGTGLSTYTYVPSYNDQVSCVMTSSATCPSGSPATSNIISMIIVAINQTVTGTVPSPLSLCYDASNTITVAGGGTTFIVQSGGSATMIAGMKISYLTGTKVHSGGYMHGYITPTHSYCGSLPPAMVALQTNVPDPPRENSPLFAIYPNPSSGDFTLVQKSGPVEGRVTVDILSMHGERLVNSSFANAAKQEFHLADLPSGLYFVRVIKENKMEIFKLVLTK